MMLLITFTNGETRSFCSCCHDYFEYDGDCDCVVVYNKGEIVGMYNVHFIKTLDVLEVEE